MGWMKVADGVHTATKRSTERPQSAERRSLFLPREQLALSMLMAGLGEVLAKDKAKNSEKHPAVRMTILNSFDLELTLKTIAQKFFHDACTPW